MKRNRNKQFNSLLKKYPPSQPCDCEICKEYCKRPGWWTVRQAKNAIASGYGGRMMLEISPDFSYGVISPAFKGCEGNFAIKEFSYMGCNFLLNGRCELYKTEFMPLECRFCHHDRKGQGQKCHLDLQKDWNTIEGQKLVKNWIELVGLKYKYKIKYL
jgi:hypothetical protein